MNKLELFQGQSVQGEFEVGKLNLLFVFQVNCLGCFLYGLPVINRLYNNPKNKNISMLGMSTAFEDFEYNNLTNTRSLVKEKTLVGETKKYLLQKGIELYPEEINFPIVMDQTLDSKEELDEFAENICVQNPNYLNWQPQEQLALKLKVLNYLQRLEVISLTFTTNQLKGTPSFILFNDRHEIIKQWFGHKDPTEIQSILDRQM